MTDTHEVANQAVPLVCDVADDPALLDAVGREAGEDAAQTAALHELGALAGSPETGRLAERANTNEPVLRTHDRFGHRTDEVEYDPAWHELMSVAVGHGLHAAPWQEDRPAGHVWRAAKFYVWSQAEYGHMCPISMTYAAVPALRHAPELAGRYEPLLAAREYDFGLRPPLGKRGLIAGMAMTEKQGGSDVRTNTTRADPLDAPGEYALTGHKWFNSAPMSDVFLVLAQAPGGLTCFLLPRVLPDGTRNRIRLQRLKDKLGNRSNASAEVEYDGAIAWRVGAEGRGVATIIEMVAMTRLDCVLGSAAGMRAATRTAVWHCAHRRAFGATLVDQPLMRSVLADLAIESEAAVALAMRLAGATQRALAGSAQEAALRRIALPVGKYWVCKRQPAHAAEALECLGGNGYIEESGMPRLYREAPLNAIWEGSGNVTALDALRAMAREPDTIPALLAELDAAAGGDARLDGAIKRLRELLEAQRGGSTARAQAGTRTLVELMARTLQGSLLVRYAPTGIAEAFCASRLTGDGGYTFGTLPAGVDVGPLIERSMPQM